MNRPFKTYNGGKSGSGVYQSIINQIPPHDVFITGFAGNCGVLAHKRPAPMANIAIDLDAAVIKAWNNLPGIIGINADAISWITNYLKTVAAGTGVFVFLDPPYLMETRAGKKDLYNFEMIDRESHLKLVQALAQWPVNICLSHYPCSFYDEHLKDWRKLDIKGRTRNGMRTERLYMNYSEPTSLHDYNYFGKDFREREEYKKMKVNMVNKFKRLDPVERNFIIDQLKQHQII